MSLVNKYGARVDVDRRPFGVWERAKAYCQNDPEAWRKMAALCLRVDGWNDHDIAVLLQTDELRVTEWIEALKHALLPEDPHE
jgi:hypothetical protein